MTVCKNSATILSVPVLRNVTRLCNKKLETSATKKAATEAGKGANHDDTGTKAAPDTSKAKLGENLTGGLASLSHLGNDGISGVRHDSADHTGGVAGSKGESLGGGFHKRKQDEIGL